MTKLFLAVLIALPLLTAPFVTAAGCCSDETCCASGCKTCQK